MTTETSATPGGATPLSLSTAAARNLATTTKTVPQMQGISSRWLLKVLPWVQVSGGVYRVNRRLSYSVGDGRVSFDVVSGQARVIPAELCELPLLRGFDDAEVLAALAGRFVQREFAPGDVLVERGRPSEEVVLIAHGKVSKIGEGRYGDEVTLGVLADGDHFGDGELVDDGDTWGFTVRAQTAGIALVLSRAAFEEVGTGSEALRAHVARFAESRGKPQNKHGESSIELASGHSGEPVLPGTFVDYEVSPREYELSVAQTVLRVHSRVADLYNDPMDQVGQQLRLTVEALRERQEHELINNREFGLLANADYKQRVHTRGGPPTPDDLDEILARRRKSQYFLAHPQAIAAFGRECNNRGIYPQTVEIDGSHVRAWRGVPILPCNKIPISDAGVTSILVMRTGEENEGVVGLRQTGIPDEYEPGLSVRFMGINGQAMLSYLVSAYYSAAILVPDALGVLENVELGH
ncbi:hypothetical protein HNP84_008280 [Thermocatellispora tengchongensis]|uniref:Cyclic nucleotide-binding domain-containing protein n=1 Tax=Thermocatellispora tengchongensis TaxID=1073253 RepID=A0A840PI65_9ACTN|nr:family 2B encapsulin nanocompartment shell protein [Thermocatellispora tengchongensis]MBB5138526.1 hypothetical protein [Thermocatellispora tengchongensis]